jgi:uncharacterized repeat protein (TIGR02543 family)
MIMGKTTLRGIALLTLALLLGSCANPFFSSILGLDEKPGEETSGETWSYTVNFDKNGGDTEAAPAAKTVASPAATTGALPETPPTRTGYTFAGWNTQQDGSGPAFTATATVSGDITVYAKWESYSYTVTFDKNGGDAEADPAVKIVASPDTTIDAVPGTPPTRTGYNFAGWNTQQDGSGPAFTATVSGDITVYAQWQRPGVFLP